MLRNLLFKLRLYRGIVIRCPSDLVICRAKYPQGILSKTYIVELNLNHGAAEWLLDECEGPWVIRPSTSKNRWPFMIAFANAADALSFRIIAADNHC
jgi:hypothetical protein